MEMPRIDTHAHIGPDTGKLISDNFSENKPVEKLAELRCYTEGARILYGVDTGALLSSKSNPAIWEKAAAAVRPRTGELMG